MTIRVALTHQSRYRFDRPVKLWPHEVRLRPAAHCRTPITGYSLRVDPDKHFLNWQQDGYGNWLARLVFPEKTSHLDITVDLVADMAVINPFDFFVEELADKFPFPYPPQLAKELAPFLETEPLTPLLAEWLTAAKSELLKHEISTIDFLVALNRRVQQSVAYIVRMEAGVQTAEETLKLKLGSCRDSGWLLVQLLRHFGLAARFASGYLIQLTADVQALDGPSGTDRDFTDLHAWAEAYVPGAGWIGLDPTSGLMAGEGHLPLACTAAPSSAAPVIGATEVCESHFDFSMTVTRIHEDPRVTKPYSESQWQEILSLGHVVDKDLTAHDVRLTMGGEPTFVSIDDMNGPEWNFTALSEKKLELAGQLLQRMERRFAEGALLHFGQGKWYPGEPLPRWALGCYWRVDGKPLWRNAKLLDHGDLRDERKFDDAGRFAAVLASHLGLSERYVIPAYEDVAHSIEEENRWPADFDPLTADLKDPDERRRIARLLEGDLGGVAGYVLPLKALPEPAKPKKTAKSAPGAVTWRSSPWPLRREHLYLIPGDSPLGLRLPLASLPWQAPDDMEIEFEPDPFAAQEALADPAARKKPKAGAMAAEHDPRQIIHTAVCIEVRTGVVHVFMPPLQRLEEYVDLLNAVEDSAAELGMALRIEGYPPPRDARLKDFKVTPDPGVIEFNIQPAASWPELVANTTALYEEARLCRLGTDKFMLDGRHAGTGGGNHVTIGAARAEDSPCLRRPDLLMSLILYWQNHPALSYLFSGVFIGPTSQAPRVDEARHESLYELEIAFQQMTERMARTIDQTGPGEETLQPWLVDRLLRNLLVDLSGNTHRAEFCIDKLYSPDGPAGRLGLVEFRGFEMPPHAQMSLVQILLLRTLITRFWKQPYQGRLIRWGTQLHDRFMLPHFVAEDMRDVVRDLQQAGYPFQFEWLAPFLEFRFPRYGSIVSESIEVELRQAIEPWNVLGEEVSASGTSRYVDSSLERLQVKIRHMTDNRHMVTCNGRPLPLAATGIRGEFVAGVRYRAWAPPSALHPTIGVHTPLVIDVVDTWSGRAVGGCTYHVVHPGGRNYESFPINANEAEGRRFSRFWGFGHTSGNMPVRREGRNPDYPLTLDLRRAPEPLLGDEALPSMQQEQQAQQ
jgi:uncharacterized protein (DUF2126 family)/transglutaminase-like putative cysteine protease